MIENTAEVHGGGMYATGLSPEVVDSKFGGTPQAATAAVSP